ncbi:MAG: lipopolysaccharide biosynthesis protein [Bacteroidales bacterium]|nr:lipopolysaccharide biosynthesis protein [Bacteroidales bacterium]
MATTSSIKKLFTDSVVYGLSSIIGRFLNYLLVPLYTYKLVHSGEYGLVTNVYAYTALLLVVLVFGMETTFFYFANQYKDKSLKVFSTASWMVGFVAACFVVLVFQFIGPISSALNYGDHPEYIKIMATTVAIDAFQAMLFSFLRFQGRAWKFASLKLLFIFLNIGLNLLVFLVAPGFAQSHPEMMQWYNPDAQVYYIFLINLICTATVTLGFLPEIWNLRNGVDFSIIGKMLRYTWPMLLLGLIGILNQVADKICYRFIMPGEEGDIQLGIYGACVKIAMIMAMITQAFRYAYEPFVFSAGKGKESKESQAKVMKYFVICTLMAFLIVMAYIDLLRYIISPKYWEGLRVVPIVMIAEIFMGIYFNLSFWYKLIAKTWWGAIFSIIGCTVLLSINFVFVPKYGYLACAWGGFCGYGVCMLLSYFVGQKYNPVHYPVMSIIAYFALAMGLYAAMTYLRPDNTILSMLLNTALIAFYAAVVLLFERKKKRPAPQQTELQSDYNTLSHKE